MKSVCIVFRFLFLSFGIYAQTGIAVQHIVGIDLPDMQYDLVIGKADSLLHFYDYGTNTDSLWVRTFTCDPQGNFTTASIIYAHHFDPVLADPPEPLLFEYNFNRLFFHAQIDSMSILICEIDESGDSWEHDINTGGVDISYLYYIPSNRYIHFTENIVVAATARTGCIYKIDLTSDDMQLLWSYPNGLYNLYPLGNDYLIMSDMLNYNIVPNYFFDNNLTMHPIPGSMFYGYNDVTKVGEYYLASGYSAIQSSAYSLIYVQNDVLFENILSAGEDIIVEDKCIVPLENNRYISIYTIHHVGGQVVMASFTTNNIENGEIVNDFVFPQLGNISNPRNLFRINDNCIVSMSGVSGGFIDFTSIDLANHQYHTDSYQIDTEPIYFLDWVAHTAGVNFYLLKQDHLHSFRVVNYTDLNDPLIPSLPALSCYPNPFNDELNIDIRLSTPSSITVNIYDVRGRKLTSIMRFDKSSLKHCFLLTKEDIHNLHLSSGVYFVQAISEKGAKMMKTVFLK